MQAGFRAPALAAPFFETGQMSEFVGRPIPGRDHNEMRITSAPNSEGAFPDQLACPENLAGEREFPDHPLVNQTISDCLHEAMDIGGLERLLKRIESGETRIVTRDLTEPSPLALEVLSARPYAYLDDAPLEERRTQAVMARRWLDPEAAADIGRLDAEAIERVRSEAWPKPENADELHEALVWLGFLTAAETDDSWCEWLKALQCEKRVAWLRTPKGALLIAAERLSQLMVVWPQAKVEPAVSAPHDAGSRSREKALVELVRGRLEGLGSCAEAALADSFGLERSEIAAPSLRSRRKALPCGESSRRALAN
jgi:ATP-dependent Lhr-like helicase